MKGEVNSLSNITSNRLISLSWGGKKKESSNFDATRSNSSCLCVGDHVIVSNQGTKWVHLAKITKISKSTAVVRWDTTQRMDTVDLSDCKKYDNEDVSTKKRKATDFYQNLPVKSQKSNASLKHPPGQMVNMFYSKDNLGKLCAEGAIRNLMNVLHCSIEDMTMFWDLATSSLSLIMTSFKEEKVPKSVYREGVGIDSIEKCLWILRKKFNFVTTSKLKVSCFQSLN